jgi:hypothetical protein
MAGVRVRGSGSVPKFHGFASLLLKSLYPIADPQRRAKRRVCSCLIYTVDDSAPIADER